MWTEGAGLLGPEWPGIPWDDVVRSWEDAAVLTRIGYVTSITEGGGTASFTCDANGNLRRDLTTMDVSRGRSHPARHDAIPWINRGVPWR